MKRLVISLALAALAVACKTAEPVPAPVESTPPQPAAPAPLPPGLDEAAMDPAANPCDDFYRYACGGWMDKTEIPADRAAWSRGFATIAERNEMLLRDILVAAAEGKAPEGTPYARELGDYWATCMDEAALESSLPLLEAELKRINTRDPASLAAAVGRMHQQGMRPLFRFGSTQDFKDATQVIGEFDQGGLGLPDRDYYVKEDAPTKAVREAYVEHVARIFELLGQKPDEAKRSAGTVMEVETALAKASLTNVERRSPEKLYHRLERKGLKAAAPAFPWDTYLKELGAPGVEQLNVTHPPFFEQVSRMAKSIRPDEWRTYLTWHFVAGSIPALPKRFQDERFRFMSKALTGAKEDLPRWKKCVSYTDAALGEALAQPFVAKYFGVEGKEITSEMVVDIQRAFAANLDTLPWMDADTRARALEKLNKFVNKIGYPEKWRSYDGLKIDRQ
ncbi:MAG: M13 family peptidase, partial [Myxococcales bacterium]